MNWLYALRDKIKHDQSPQAQHVRVGVEWDIREQEHDRAVRILRLARLLYTAYWRTGSMSVLLRDGRQVTDRPGYGGSEVQHIWNARDTAMRLAALSIDSLAALKAVGYKEES